MPVGRVAISLLVIAFLGSTAVSLALLFEKAHRRPQMVRGVVVDAPPAVVHPPVVIPARTQKPVKLRAYATPEESVVLNEILYHPETDDIRDEWIEVFNRGEAPVDIEGWKLVDGVSFTFPAGSRLEPGGHLVVCADAARTRAAFGIENAVGDWTGSLKDGGGRVCLVSARGTDADAVPYDDEPPYPVLADGLGRSLERRDPHAPGDFPGNWGAATAGGWVRARVEGVATSSRIYIYLLGPGAACVDDLSLRPVGSRASEGLHSGFESNDLAWRFNGNHAGSHVTSDASLSGKKSLRIVATGAGQTNATSATATVPGVIQGGRYELEVWALFEPDSPPLVVRFSQATRGGGTLYAEVSPVGSTPGRTNSLATGRLPPFVHPVGHVPPRPRSGDAVVVTARIAAPGPVAEAWLLLDDGRGEERVPLRDDGEASSGDAARGDGVFAARIGPFPAGRLVRYRVAAGDGLGGIGSFPLEGNPTRTLGFHVEDPRLDAEGGADVPVYHIIMAPEALADLDANPHSDAYRPGVFIRDGQVHCDVGVRYRGQTSRGIPKHHWKVKFRKDYPFVFPGPGGERAGGINLQSCFGDKTFLRELLGYRLWSDMGEATCEAWHVRAYLNGSYLGLFLHLENPGGDFLSRNGLEEGWLWKCYSGAQRTGQGFELEAGEPATAGDVLEDFIGNMNTLSGAALERYIREHMLVDSFVNYLAGCQLIHNGDHIEKNYLLYADQGMRFTMFPWDLDLTHGRNYECDGGGIWNDVMRHDMWDGDHDDDELLFGTRSQPKCGSGWNAIIDAFLRRTDAFRPLYYRRIADHLAHHYHPDILVPKIEALRAEIRADALRDRAQWGTYPGDPDFDRQCDRLVRWARRRFDYLKDRLARLGHPVGEPIRAEFESPSRSGPAPFRAVFKDLSVGKVEAHEWDFGDGSLSADREPEHIYAAPGKYDVRLTVRGPAGEHAAARRRWVVVTAPSG
jgi:spore coat protein H